MGFRLLGAFCSANLGVVEDDDQSLLPQVLQDLDRLVRPYADGNFHTVNVRAIEKPPTDNDVQPMLLRDNADTMGVDVVRASFERDEKFFRRRFYPARMKRGDTK